MLTNLAKYAKAAVAAVGVAAAVLTALNVHAPWVSAVVAAATALGVLAVPNKRPAPRLPGRPAARAGR